MQCLAGPWLKSLSQRATFQPSAFTRTSMGAVLVYPPPSLSRKCNHRLGSSISRQHDPYISPTDLRTRYQVYSTKYIWYRHTKRKDCCRRHVRAVGRLASSYRQSSTVQETYIINTGTGYLMVALCIWYTLDRGRWSRLDPSLISYWSVPGDRLFIRTPSTGETINRHRTRDVFYCCRVCKWVIAAIPRTRPRHRVVPGFSSLGSKSGVGKPKRVQINEFRQTDSSEAFR